MKENFKETIMQRTDRELEIIIKDYAFYSDDERLIALNELEFRNGSTAEISATKKDIEYSKEMEEEAEKPTHSIKFKDLIPHKGYLFTPLLILANILVFVSMVLLGMDVFTPSIEFLVQWGGNIRFLTMNGELWRLLTCTFVHFGIIHLVFNMLALLYVGSLLEKTIGKSKFIFAYLICGIIASISSLIVHENLVSVGASGAIFGIFGVLLSLLIFKKHVFPNISALRLFLYVFVFVLYNVLTGFGKSGIDNAAHVGGLFTGITIGIFYSVIIKRKVIGSVPSFTYKIVKDKKD